LLQHLAVFPVFCLTGQSFVDVVGGDFFFLCLDQLNPGINCYLFFHDDVSIIRNFIPF
jgi:hypothetical protein